MQQFFLACLCFGVVACGDDRAAAGDDAAVIADAAAPPDSAASDAPDPAEDSAMFGGCECSAFGEGACLRAFPSCVPVYGSGRDASSLLFSR